MRLAEFQHQIRNAVVNGQTTSAALLVGGVDPLARLAVHQRHYEASLADAIIGRFPATGWLVGPSRLDTAARAFVHAHPPTAPCIAEYGQQFPAFLAVWPGTATLGYLPEFAALDWQLGRLAVCVEAPNLSHADLARLGSEQLLHARAIFQDGLYLTRATWPLDDLMQRYLADTSPDQWVLGDEDVRLQVRGARGALQFARLSTGTLAFRRAIAAGDTLAGAATHAADADPDFDPATALLALIDEGLVTRLVVQQERHPR